MKMCTPWDWQQLIRSTGATVFEMQLLYDFKNFEALYSGTGSPLIQKKQTEDKESFLVSSAVWLEVPKQDPGILYKKTDILQEYFKMVNMNRFSRKPIELPLELCSPRQTPKGFSKKKHDNLLVLLQWIPEAFNDFYKNIPVLGQQGDDDDDDD
ncbi:unnamed protein product [Acanthoscelides obtectus]|uniref:Uncharacterized protein n=1 Tax=Acanthoscelides obtectus TaxID=200917 RepID=A0A9P0LQR8_ACAOB|nr:unnamed protein product [Acanthoscelides obtectus]CAK1686240.1 hypothetical protein AOBTE_LOCUS35863 [Acanthoscelides obtectus]